MHLKSHKLLTGHTNTHSYKTHANVHIPPQSLLLTPSVAHEVKVLMSSPYQQMPSWACHRWLAWSQQRGQMASSFKGSSPDAASPGIPKPSNSLCYIYCLHLDNILSFPSQVKLQRPPSNGMSRGVENLILPLRPSFLFIGKDFSLLILLSWLTRLLNSIRTDALKLYKTGFPV